MKTIIGLALGAALASGQQHAQLEKTVRVATAGEHMSVVTPAGGLQHMEMIGGAEVKGAPFAAEGITESVQTLADGNRIVHKNSQKIYRDSEGRTRYEMSFSPVGAWTPAESGHGSVVIGDPVKREHYTLNPAQKTATRVVLSPLTHGSSGGAAAQFFRLSVPPPASGGSSGGRAVFVQEDYKVRFPSGKPGAWAPEVRREPLGKQIIEGLECEGTRSTVTLPAGAMGNERAIDTVSEVWVSTALKMDILRKSKDPRSGETTYRLTAIMRGEQPRSLFEIPPDYKVEESRAGGVFVMEKKDARK